MDVTKIGVIGAGAMGHGIAQVAAVAGYRVILNDIEQRFVDGGLTRIETSLAKLASKDRLQEPAADIRARVSGSTDLADLADCDLVIEAIIEDLAIKRKLFRDLGGIVKEDAILASNTSSISITDLALHSGRPERFMGMHFMNPVPIMALVELIRGHGTNEATYLTVKAVAERMGKVTAVSEDYPGFLANRILMPMINEAIFTLHEGVGSAADIDLVMQKGMNHPIGPLALADLIGLDVCLAILDVLYEGFRDPKYRPCPLLVKMVGAGELGRKTHKGFFEYPAK